MNSFVFECIRLEWRGAVMRVGNVILSVFGCTWGGSIGVYKVCRRDVDGG